MCIWVCGHKGFLKDPFRCLLLVCFTKEREMTLWSPLGVLCCFQLLNTRPCILGVESREGSCDLDLGCIRATSPQGLSVSRESVGVGDNKSTVIYTLFSPTEACGGRPRLSYTAFGYEVNQSQENCLFCCPIYGFLMGPGADDLLPAGNPGRGDDSLLVFSAGCI